MGFTIQAGAFSELDNAVGLTDSLNSRGLEAYYFVYRKGLYKVRFGNFTTRDLARMRAENLMAEGVIREYYIVRPGEYAVARGKTRGAGYLREQLAKTAKSFIGVPYRWGGESAIRGFDCSGLAMTVYKLNGLNLPRTSREQFRRGLLKDMNAVRKGDLVFFDTNGRGYVSHVGVFLGNGKFIHAPGRGKRVRMDSLSKNYYLKRFAGARSYI